MSLILASTSPRRKDLLALLQVPFQIAEPGFAEHLSRDRPPDEQALMFAEGKARSCAERFPGSLILGSDTLIALNGEVMGKPSSLADARVMLLRLRGRAHVIHTAVVLLRRSDTVRDAAVETVLVWMRQFDEAELEAYLHTGECLGKAGAYSIQGVGGRFIERIEGDYTAAVGLPLRLVAGLLQKRGVALPVDVEQLYRDKPYPNWWRFQR